MLRNELLIFFPQREFWSSEEVKGYAELRLPFPMQISQVNLEFYGREFIEVGGKKEFNQFLHIFSQLEGPGSKPSSGVVKGLLGSLTSFVSGGSKVEQVPAGSHRYPFTFKIPDVTPPTYTTPNGGHIDYELRVTVVNPGQGMSNLVSSARVPIAGSLFDMNLLGNTSTPFQVKENKSFFMARSTLDVTCNFESRVFLTGDPIRVNMDVVNNTTKDVTGFTVKLIQKIDILGKAPKSDEYMLASHTIGDLTGKQEKHPNFQLLVPTTAVESVFAKEIGKNLSVGKIVQISYTIKIHASISMATDLDMVIPIYIVGRARHEQLIAAHQKQFPHLYQTQQQPQQVHQFPNAPPVSDVFQQPQSQYYPQQTQQQQYPQQGAPQQQYQQLPPPPQQQYQTQGLPQQQYPQQTYHSPQQPQYSPQQTAPYDNNSGMYPSTTFYPSVESNNQQPRVTSPVLPPIPIAAYENAARRQIEQEKSGNSTNNELLLEDYSNMPNMQAQPSYDEFFE